MRWTWRQLASEVTFDYNNFTGTRRLVVDGAVVARSGGLSPRWTHRFAIADLGATLRVRTRWLFVIAAELEIGGRVVEPVDAPPSMPGWIALFAVANLAILIAARGGMVAGALAAVGLLASGAIARTRLPLPIRLALCALATSAAWASHALLVHLLAG